MKRKFTALGANIFAGSFSYGVKQAGFELLGHLEHGAYGVKTAQLNFPKLEVRVGRNNWNETDYKGKVDFMYCNPPCAAWSTARSGQGGTWEDQTHRLVCVDDCVEAGLAVRPKAWCWESVTNAWRMGQRFVLHQAERWNDAGYHCTVLLQDNQFLGAAQARQRMFLIAHRHPLVWPRLTATTTVEEAWASMPKRLPPEPVTHSEMQPYWKQRLWRMSDQYNGYFRRTHEMEGRGPKKLEGRIPSVLVRKLQLDKPAPVMLASSIRLHPTERRYVNWYEWLALCGLPMTWKTSCGGADSATQELARAVLAPVGKWLGTAVRKGLELPALRTRPSTRVVDLRDPEHPSEHKLFDFDGFTIKPFDLTQPPPKPPSWKMSRCTRCKKEFNTKNLSFKKLCDECRAKEGDPSAKKRLERQAERAERTPRKPGSGVRIREMILKGWPWEKIVPVIHKEFPGSKAGKADVSYHRYHMRKEGVQVPA